MFRELIFRQVDVFAESMFTGNAAMVVFGGMNLDSHEMQAIASETNLSETVFVLDPVGNADYRIRTFTTRREIPFSGHPSLAAAHAYSDAHSNATLALVQEDEYGLTSIHRQRPGSEWFLQLPPSSISPAAMPPRNEIAQLFGTAIDSLLVRRPQLVSTGVRWLIVEARDPETLSNLRPDHARIADWSVANKAAGVTVFARAAGPDVDPTLRTFAPAEGIYEDPVCGSCAGAMAAVLRNEENDPPIAKVYTFLQGKGMNRPGRMTVRVETDGSLHLGGKTVTSISGYLRM